VAVIVELNYYPIKGCAGTSVCDAVLTPAGLKHDRSFMVISTDGVFYNQRHSPRVALIHPELTAGGEQLTLRAPGASVLHTDVNLAAARRDVELFGMPYKGIDQGDVVAGWLSEVLGTPTRLVRVPPEHDRVTRGKTPGTAGYADSSPLLITSLSSLEMLNEQLAKRGGGPLPMNRFRPNIVVDGWDEPHIEDRARRISTGDTELGYEGGVAFGVRFAVVRPGKLSVGEEVIVSSWGESEL
jgi:uncharacterized protein YcbX